MDLSGANFSAGGNPQKLPGSAARSNAVDAESGAFFSKPSVAGITGLGSGRSEFQARGLHAPTAGAPLSSGTQGRPGTTQCFAAMHLWRAHHASWSPQRRTL